MALPVAPSISSLLTEAFQRARGEQVTPTTEQLQRAENNWLQEVIDELSSLRNWNPGEETIVLIPVAYVTVYAIPSPLFNVREVWFYRGDITGTAQAGASNSITLAAATTATENELRGKKLYLTSGTGAGQSNRITAYNSSTKVATVACAWATNPSSDTTYMVEDTEYQVSGPTPSLPRHGISPGTSITGWDVYENQVHINPPLDNAGEYALELRGQVDLMLVDETDARWTRILREWREPIVRGIMQRIYEDDDDENAIRYEGKVNVAKLNVARRDSRRKEGQMPGFKSVGGLPRRRY